MYPSDYIFILLRYKLTENVTLAELKSVHNIYHFCKRSWTSYHWLSYDLAKMADECIKTTNAGTAVDDSIEVYHL